MSHLRIAGIVLAGGLSRRMGQDKAQLKWQQQSLLARSVALLESASLKDIFVSGDYPEYSCIPDIYSQLGPLSGLHACVDALYESYDALFVLPIDMPLLTVCECNWLLTQFACFPQGVYYQDATFPMILPLNASLKEYLADILATKDKKQRSLYRLLKTSKAQAVSYLPSQAFRFQNSNTPEQWQSCLAIHHQLKDHKDIS